MQETRFAAIKRDINNDGPMDETEGYLIKIFDNRKDAATWLVDQYDFWESNAGVVTDVHDENDWKVDNPDWNSLYNFFMDSNNTEAIFHWGWKRRGNKTTYKIIEYSDILKFYATAKNLFKLKDNFVKLTKQ